jgi:hypothetical protein
MISFRINFKLKGAKQTDYDRLFSALKTELISKLRLLKSPPSFDPARGAEFVYLGGASLQEVTAASYHAAHTVGKEYSFTIIKHKGAVNVIAFENELIW